MAERNVTLQKSSSVYYFSDNKSGNAKGEGSWNRNSWENIKVEISHNI